MHFVKLALDRVDLRAAMVMILNIRIVIILSIAYRIVFDIAHYLWHI
jgi:hypothetical protein